jgi:hypothetical protein
MLSRKSSGSTGVHIRMRRTTLIAAMLALGLAVPSQGQADAAPDARGEAFSRESSYQGESTRTLRDPAKHVQNEGGWDGAGLCVIASITANGIDQGVPGLDVPGDDGDTGHGSALWKTAKGRRGGYSPGKLQSLVQEVMPDEKWASYYGDDPSVLDKLSRAGYPIGATMSTGRLYGYKPIHHMISLAHYRENGWACVVDNNQPGVYSWMPAKEFVRRWFDGGSGWAWTWTRKPPTTAVAWLAILALAAAAALIARTSHTRRLSTDSRAAT